MTLSHKPQEENGSKGYFYKEVVSIVQRIKAEELSEITDQ